MQCDVEKIRKNYCSIYYICFNIDIEKKFKLTKLNKKIKKNETEDS